MTGTIEHPKRTGGASNDESANLVQAGDILTPEELAAYAFSLRSPRGSRNRGSRCPTPGFYEKTRGRCRVCSGSSALAAQRATGPIPSLRLGRYVRFNWVAVGTWLTAPTPPETRPATPDLTSRRKPATPVSPRPA
jgi:hypothetical protein